ncbi:tetratricopeptide repeat protein [Alteromonas sp. ASW11-36]|uniref:Tetratricopeptide repeat protein n=1 Tax=Alteromonas arenosi TaxID=3055817 RepID=A0ABT7SZ97_9ALTE|nr:tetratricopeptide repeat protein [Alteromonas sp. ASW11-36]MDM7861500.1 tetratricopeptide repeat protein [Alteromonas sp. ASW11-36]
MRKNIVSTLLTTLLGLAVVGCSSTSDVVIEEPAPLLNDAAFPGYELFPVESKQEVFALSPEAKAFVDRVIWKHDDPDEKIKALVDKIFDRSSLNLLYSNDANTTASQTFDSRAANCISMSIMTYALANYAGFDATFQDIQIPEYWTRRDGYSLLNGHINLKVKPGDKGGVLHFVSREVIIDFDPQESRRHFEVVEMSADKALAMFYNNKGADALIADSYSQAYAYFKAAATVAPDFDGTWVNLGILYRRAGFIDLAKASYQRAIEADHDNLTAWENLAYVHHLNGEEETANAIFARVERQRLDNPFYHFILGEQALEEGELERALGFYRAAYRLDNQKHEILFGLSKVYYALGDIDRAQRFLSMAKRRASNAQDEERYQGKLAVLQNR